MPACPVCDTDNPQNAVECASCGRVLRRPTDVPGFAAPIEGLEGTLHAPVDAAVEAFPELEQTALSAGSLRVPEERLAVDRTAHEPDGAAPNWTPGPLELDRGRDEDADPRTSPPAAGACPWCGAASTSAVCDSCGRHRGRNLVAPLPPPEGIAPEEATVLCPACFARVASGPRCPECGVPLPLRGV